MKMRLLVFILIAICICGFLSTANAQKVITIPQLQYCFKGFVTKTGYTSKCCERNTA